MIWGASACMRCIERNWLTVSGTITARTTTVRPMIARPQLPPTMFSWMNTRIDSNSEISGPNASSMISVMLAKMGMRVRWP